MFPCVHTHTHTSIPVCTHTHTCEFYAHTSTAMCTGTRPHFHVHTGMVPRNLVSPSLYPRVPCPRAHMCTTPGNVHTHPVPASPSLALSPGDLGQAGGLESLPGRSPSAPAPGGLQVHRPGPRLAGREGPVITRPRGPPPPSAFHPVHAQPEPRRSLLPPTRSLAGVRGRPDVRRARPRGEDRGGSAGARRPRPRLRGNAGAALGVVFGGRPGRGVL